MNEVTALVHNEFELESIFDRTNVDETPSNSFDVTFDQFVSKEKFDVDPMTNIYIKSLNIFDHYEEMEEYISHEYNPIPLLIIDRILSLVDSE